MPGGSVTIVSVVVTVQTKDPIPIASIFLILSWYSVGVPTIGAVHTIMGVELTPVISVLAGLPPMITPVGGETSGVTGALKISSTAPDTVIAPRSVLAESGTPRMF